MKRVIDDKDIKMNKRTMKDKNLKKRKKNNMYLSSFYKNI